jgi:hypothetical protein
MQHEHTGTQVGIGLPDMPRYRVLLGRSAEALDRLDIHVFFVAQDTSVQQFIPRPGK